MKMYRSGMIAVVALAMSLAAAPAFAQAATQPAQQQQVNSGVGIGALGGISWTSIRTETNEQGVDFNTGTGWQLGIWFGGNRDGRVGLMGELSYAVKKISDEFDNEVERDYVQLPVLLRINAGSRQKNKPSLYFLAGPVFDIEVSTKQVQDGQEIDTPDDVYQGLEIGLMFGAGFEVARIGIEGRYSWGFKSVLATDAAEESGFGSSKLNTFSLVAKIRFN
jgi:hypothetical protein